MIEIGVDFETWSEADIKLGAYHYATHPSTQAVMLSYRPVGSSDWPALWWYGQPCPDLIVQHALSGGVFVGWNSLNFERQIWRHVCVAKYGWPELRDDQWQDSMLRAIGNNLPRSLGAAALAVGTHDEKSKEGHKVMKELTSGKRTSWPKLWGEKLRPKLIYMGGYCCLDTVVEDQTAQRTPPWIAADPWPRMPAVDMRINDRGIMCDLPLVQNMRRASEEETHRLDWELAKVSNGRVAKLTEVQQLKTWLLDLGVRLPLVDDAKRNPEDDVPEDEDPEFEPPAAKYRLRKNDVIDLLAGDLPGDFTDDRGQVHGLARDVLQMRADAAKISAKKLAVMERAAASDWRLRGALVLGGAQATMRWSGGIYQPHNFPRNVLPDGGKVEADIGRIMGRKFDKAEDKKLYKRLMAEALDTAVQVGTYGDAATIRAAYGPVLPFVSRMLRRTLMAKPGHTLLQGDFAQVEARIVAWLAGQFNILKAFANREDVYVLAALPLVGKSDPKLVTKEERQLGKIAVLGNGFGGGAGVFVVMSMNYGIRITREQAKPIVDKWRKANDAIAKYWYASYEAACNAVKYPGKEFPVAPFGLCSYFMMPGRLVCRLPSGRLLSYWAPEIVGTDKFGKPVLFVNRVRGANTSRQKMWHGLLVENQVQGIAADLLANGLANMDLHGRLPVVLHVHDSIAAEVPEDQAEHLMSEFEEAFVYSPGWDRGLPTMADIHIGARFG